MELKSPEICRILFNRAECCWLRSLQVGELQSAVMKIGENLSKDGGDAGGDAAGGAGGGAEGTTYDAEAKEEKK